MLFEIDEIPISTNQSLMVSNGRMVHSAVARVFKASATLAISNQLDQHLRVDPTLRETLIRWSGEPLYCQIQVFGDWMTKTGTIRKSDLMNREKLLVDCCFSVFRNHGFDLDDSQIYLMVMGKHEAVEGEKTVLMLSRLCDFKCDV